MPFDIQLRAEIKQQLADLAAQMSQWEARPWVDDRERTLIRDGIQPFAHAAKHGDLIVAGVDATGDFPSATYGDSSIYVTVARSVAYAADKVTGLKEVAPGLPPIVEFTWLPGDDTASGPALEEAFARLAGAPVRDVIEASDYRVLKAEASGRAVSVAALQSGLIKPHGADAGNIGIQLRSAAEFGAVLRLLQSTVTPTYLLFDSTLSLPLVKDPEASLFYEHLKRLCCVEARYRGVGFFALSKSHGLPGTELVEELAREQLGLASGATPEHWYWRLPGVASEMEITRGRRVPPPGAVSYLVRFHRTAPIMRLDMDLTYWLDLVQGDTAAETAANERQIFEALDYSGHAYQSYGYPYPLRASRDRAVLNEAERVTLRKQIIDAGVRAGLKRTMFRDPSAGDKG